MIHRVYHSDRDELPKSGIRSVTTQYNMERNDGTPKNKPSFVGLWMGALRSAEIGAILGFFHGWDYEANFSYGA